MTTMDLGDVEGVRTMGKTWTEESLLALASDLDALNDQAIELYREYRRLLREDGIPVHWSEQEVGSTSCGFSIEKPTVSWYERDHDHDLIEMQVSFSVLTGEESVEEWAQARAAQYRAEQARKEAQRAATDERFRLAAIRQAIETDPDAVRRMLEETEKD